MTVEKAAFVYIDRDAWDGSLASLAAQARRCVERHAKAAPGDRREMLKFDGICLQMESFVRLRFEAGAPAIELSLADVADADTSGKGRGHFPWYTSIDALPDPLRDRLGSLRARLSNGGVVFQLRDPFGTGRRLVASGLAGSPVEPLERWRPPGEEVGLAAVAVRWNGQLAAALAGGAEPIVPSGVSNRVLTEGLRQYAQREAGRGASDVRVVYRDGSEARAFPLGASDLCSELPVAWPMLRVALLSMRHPEMDADVDASWLRNRDISQARPAAETDAIVHDLSRAQLRELASHGPRVVHLYQTGLEPAIVGFYRALIQHLLEAPGSVAVSPHYFRRNGTFERGAPWATAV